LNDRLGIINDVVKVQNLPTLGTNKYNIALFGTIHDGVFVTNEPFVGRIYYCQISQGVNLVRDFIPVRVGNVGYMYDKISGKLFENQGTGNFILGPDKENTEEIIIEQEIMESKLPISLTSTGTYTFQNCSNLNNIIIPSNI
jgi:hypothetical protein